MISQSLYHALCISGQHSSFKEIEELKQFCKPYVLVIHQPSGRGFYLNRNYRHITDVSNCQEPKNPVERQGNHLCASGNLPDWVLAEKCHEFTTFWLY